MRRGREIQFEIARDLPTDDGGDRCPCPRINRFPCANIGRGGYVFTFEQGGGRAVCNSQDVVL